MSTRDQSLSSSTSRGSGRAIDERSRSRLPSERLDREAQAYREASTAGGGSSGGGISSPPSAGGGEGGTANLVGLQHEFAADDSTVDGIQSGHLVNGARVAFDLEDAAGDVSPLDGIVLLFENGVQLSALLSDYSVSGNTLTFTTAPRGRISGWCLKAPASTHPA